MTTWDITCEFVEERYPSVKAHIETHTANCGISKEVYRGQLVNMLEKFLREREKNGVDTFKRRKTDGK